MVETMKVHAEVAGEVKPSAHVAKARVSPRRTSGMIHPYADPH